MINSMTGFSRCSSEQEQSSLVWELRSVNHRYLDVVLKIPDEFRGIENQVRKQLGKVIKRGKLECNLRYKTSLKNQAELNVNEEYATAVLNACLKISKKLHQPIEMDAIEILKWPGVINEPEIDVDSIAEAALKLFDQALNDLGEARQSEGQRLQQMIEERCAAMQKIVSEERSRRPQVLQQSREKMHARLQELQVEYDADRFEQELAYLAQKMDVDEELDRLDSHFAEIEKILKRNEPTGRRLDFIMQELNREANTLGSKSNNIETTQASVELKVLIEQMREQVQNIE